MTTKHGSKLIISGWWGRSRHPNYMYAVLFVSSHWIELTWVLQLLQGWPNHGSLMVPPNGFWNSPHILLCDLLRSFAYPSTETRWWTLRQKASCFQSHTLLCLADHYSFLGMVMTGRSIVRLCHGGSSLTFISLECDIESSLRPLAVDNIFLSPQEDRF